MKMPSTMPSVGKMVNWAIHETQNPKWSGLASRLIWVFDALLSTAILWKINCTLLSKVMGIDMEIRRSIGELIWSKWSRSSLARETMQ